MKECNHKWVFQEKQMKTATRNDNGRTFALFHRVDRYYCEHCLEIRELEQREEVSLPFGGIRHLDNFAPIWYQE